MNAIRRQNLNRNVLVLVPSTWGLAGFNENYKEMWHGDRDGCYGKDDVILLIRLPETNRSVGKLIYHTDEGGLLWETWEGEIAQRRLLTGVDGAILTSKGQAVASMHRREDGAYEFLLMEGIVERSVVDGIYQCKPWQGVLDHPDRVDESLFPYDDYQVSTPETIEVEDHTPEPAVRSIWSVIIDWLRFF